MHSDNGSQQVESNFQYPEEENVFQDKEYHGRCEILKELGRILRDAYFQFKNSPNNVITVDTCFFVDIISNTKGILEAEVKQTTSGVHSIAFARCTRSIVFTHSVLSVKAFSKRIVFSKFQSLELSLASLHRQLHFVFSISGAETLTHLNPNMNTSKTARSQ